jgi:alpha-galactosidase
MKKVFMIIAAMCMTSIMASAQKTIRVSTDKTDLVMQVSPKGRLYQVYLGDKLKNPSDYNQLKWDVYAASDGAVCQRGHEVYATSGAEDFFEPAVAVTHADGNMTTYLYYQSSEEKAISGGVETIITLKDKVYPLTVKLHYAAYPKENVIKAWSEISHKEKAPVTLWRYSSTMLYFKANKYFVTNYHSDWAKEGQPETCQLTAGKKIVDTKLGTRAAMQEEPFFELGFDEPAKENEGKVMLGTIGWPGNFRFTFEVDNVGALRVIPAINPYASNYKLKAGETFTTPEFIFAMSDNGIGEASRNLHNWARQYQVNMGMEDRLTLLNNWENTGFDFNQQSLAELMKDAKDLGVDMFLLDDGWFANKYPRKDDHAGLGDWEATKSKLPDGIPGLVRDAKKAGVKFGIWIEPEMVNPKSELFEKHPDWVIMQPKRDTYYYDRDISEYILASKSRHGRGGMTSKVKTAHDVANAGIKVIIANGNTPNILINLKEHPMETLHTEFVARPLNK